MWHFYVRGGIAYVPKVLKTDVGFFLDSDPVAVIPLADAERLIDTLVTAIRNGNEGGKAPARHEYGMPVVARAAGVSDWSTFARTARLFRIRQTESGYEIAAMGRASDGAWSERRFGDRVEHVTAGPTEAARRLVAKAVQETFN